MGGGPGKESQGDLSKDNRDASHPCLRTRTQLPGSFQKGQKKCPRGQQAAGVSLGKELGQREQRLGTKAVSSDTETPWGSGSAKMASEKRRGHGTR